MFSFQLFPWQDFVVLVVPRLNEECVQKPVTERTHSEGTSQHKGRRNNAGVSVFSCSVSSLLNTVVSVVSQRNLQTPHLVIVVFLICFPSYCNRKGLSVSLSLWTSRAILPTRLPVFWGLRLKHMRRTWRSLALEARGYEFHRRHSQKPSTRLARTLHFKRSRRTPRDSRESEWKRDGGAAAFVCTRECRSFTPLAR